MPTDYERAEQGDDPFCPTLVGGEASELLALRAGNDRLREALDQAEAAMSIVAPRSDAAEYRRILGVVRAALEDAPQ